MKLIKNIIILSAVSSSLLLAAPVEISDVLKEVKVPKEVSEKKKDSLIEIDGIEKYTPALKDDKSGKRVLIKEFIIENAFNIDNKELQELIKPYANRLFSFSEIQNIASIITKEYRDRGYFVARAYIPEQNMKENKLKITVVEGQYGDFKLKNNSLVKDSVVQGFLDNTKLDGTIRVASIEKASLTRTLLIINDLPGVVISKANVRPGKRVGTSDFDVVADTQANYDGYLLVDNLGGHYTGKNRLMAGVNLNSPFSAGDKLSLNGLISNGEDLVNGAVSYLTPLNYSGLNATFSYSDTTYHLTKDFASLDAQGYSKSVSLKLDYPILRTRLENLSSYITFSNNKLEDETKSTNDITQKTSNTATVGLDYDNSGVLFNIQNQTKLSLGLTYGNLDFENQDKKSSDATGADTQGDFSKINFKISEDMYLTNNLSLESSLLLQYALGDKNLDGSEDLSIGGAYGVKAYPSGEFSAENGYIFSIEAKYQLPNIYSLSNQIGIFYDAGRAFVSNNTNNLVIDTHKSLQNIGIGYYAFYKDFFGKLQVAWTANSEAVSSEPTANSRVLFQGGWSF